jgi:hypothetical protein
MCVNMLFCLEFRAVDKLLNQKLCHDTRLLFKIFPMLNKFGFISEGTDGFCNVLGQCGERWGCIFGLHRIQNKFYVS